MNSLNVYAAPLPFSNKQIKLSCPLGSSLREIVDNACPEEIKTDEIGAIVMIEGEIILPQYWEIVRPKLGTLVNVRIVPTGGGGGKKNPIATLLSIAVLVAAPALAGAILGGGIIAGTATGAALISSGLTAAIGAVGKLAISALAPPPKPSGTGYNGNTSVQNAAESPTQFIEGAKNSIVRYGVVPVCLGTNRMFPLQAATPFTETQDSDQYVRQLFTYGYGTQITISDLKIGETDLTEFSDFDIEHKLAGDLHSGTTLYTNDVFQDNLSVLLTAAGGYTTRTTQLATDEAIVDLTLPQGLVLYNSQGRARITEVEYEIEFAVAGSGTWVPFEITTLSGSQKEALRKSIRIVFPSNDQWDIRIRRNTADSTSDQIFDKIFFTALKSVKYQSPVNLEGINGTAIRIKATDQLNGALDQLNAIVSNEIPDYDVGSDTWITRATSNCASIYRYVLQGLPNGKALSDAKLNLDDIEAWHAHCITENYTYNRVIDYETSVDEVLRDVASAGAASPNIVDGLRTIAVDQVKEDIVQIVTPRNSNSYSGEISYPELPHAFRMQFRNADTGYIQDERIVYDDGFDETNATNFEVIDVQSCTNSDLAFKIGRRHIAAARLRPEEHSWQMDVEHIIFLRGDRIKLEHDAPIIGIGDGRIKTIITSGDSPDTVTGFTIDDSVTIPDTSTYFVRIRLADGTQLYEELVTSVGETSTFTFLTPLEIADTPAAGDLCYFVETGKEVDLIITRIEPSDDLTARVTGIDYAQPDINQSENSPIPGFSSNITTPLEFIRPLSPLLIESQSDESAMLINSDGTFTPRGIFTLENRNENDILISAKVRASGTSTFTTANVLEASPEILVITGLEDNTRYDIHIFYKRLGSSMFSLPLEINSYLFVGASGTPNDVTDFTIDVVGESALLKWTANTDIDLSHYIIKYSNIYSGASYETAQIIEDNIFENRITVPFLGGTYFIKAVDLTGNESDDAAVIVTFDPGSIINVVEVITENPTFAGTLDNTVIVNNSIILADTDLTTGTYTFANSVDLGAIFPAFISGTVIAGGTFVNDIFDFTDIFAEDDIFGLGGNDFFAIADLFAEDDVFGIGTDSWSVELQYRITQTDPNDSPAGFGDWTTFAAGTIEFWAIEFRIVLTSLAENISPQVTTLSVSVDMPDRIERGDDITVAAAGDTITFDPEFKAIPAVAITLQDAATDDKIEFTSKTAAGFTFRVFNDTASAYVERSYDYIASGFGRKNT